jgi:hypothetical protein
MLDIGEIEVKHLDVTYSARLEDDDEVLKLLTLCEICQLNMFVNQETRHS